MNVKYKIEDIFIVDVFAIDRCDRMINYCFFPGYVIVRKLVDGVYENLFSKEKLIDYRMIERLEDNTWYIKSLVNVMDFGIDSDKLVFKKDGYISMKEVYNLDKEVNREYIKKLERKKK